MKTKVQPKSRLIWINPARDQPNCFLQSLTSAKRWVLEYPRTQRTDREELGIGPQYQTLCVLGHVAHLCSIQVLNAPSRQLGHVCCALVQFIYYIHVFFFFFSPVDKFFCKHNMFKDVLVCTIRALGCIRKIRGFNDGEKIILISHHFSCRKG